MPIGSTLLLPYTDGALAAAAAQRVAEAAPAATPRAAGSPAENEARSVRRSRADTVTTPSIGAGSLPFATQRLAQEHGSGRPPFMPHRRGVAAYPSVASLAQILAPSGLVPLSDQPGQALDLYA
jgi:hypothetical protein